MLPTTPSRICLYVLLNTPCAGLEPATPGLEVRCAIHCANRATLLIVLCFSQKEAPFQSKRQKSKPRTTLLFSPTTSQSNYIIAKKKRIGAAEARWAHNPKVRGSKPRFAILFFSFFCFLRLLNSEPKISEWF